jgi:hypothetical protein
MVSIAMVLLVLIANLIAFQYGAGAIRAAVDDGARWGSALGRGVEDCEVRAKDVLRGDSGLLRGGLGDSIAVACTSDGAVMAARATGRFEWWVGGLAGVDIDIEGRSVVEQSITDGGE